MQYYRQCKIEKDNIVQIAWIPEHLATVGKNILIHSEPGWVVKEVWGRQDAEYLLHHERDYRNSFPSIE